MKPIILRPIAIDVEVDRLGEPVGCEIDDPPFVLWRHRHLDFGVVEGLGAPQRKMKGIGDHRTSVRQTQARDGDVVRRRAEAEGVSRVKKGAKEISGGKGLTASRRQGQNAAAADGVLPAMPQANQLEIKLESMLGLIQDVNVEAICALVGHDDLHRPESAAQGIPHRLGLAG
jgi:hypothetical protein